MKKRVISILLAVVLLVGMLPTQVFAEDQVSGNQVPVENNVIDIADNKFASISKYHSTVTNLTIGGAVVTEAYQDNKTIYVLLSSQTADDAQITTEFGVTTSSFTVTGAEGSLRLVDGKGEISQKLVGKYSGRLEKGNVTYTVKFMKDEPKTAVPTRIQATDSMQTYNGVAKSLNVSQYFEDAETYYVVENGQPTAMDGKNYTIRFHIGGTHTLTFAAGNSVGMCPDYVTVTVEVTEIKSGLWIGHTTSNGSWDYVLFKDADGNEINGLAATLDGKTINVLLPKTYAPDGKVIATFSLTQNGSVPVLTTSTATAGTSSSQWTGKAFTQKTFTLSGGKASFSFYYCNQSPKNESATSWTINIEMLNDIPTLAQGQAATAEKTITAGKTYSLDLAPVFADADGDAMTYQVSVNGAAAVAADVNYTFSTNTAGTYTLVFTANDGKGTSTDTYTVTLTVENATDTLAMTVHVPVGVVPAFYVSSGFDANGVDVAGAAIEAAAGAAVQGMTAYTLQYPANAEVIGFRADGWGGMTFAAQEDGTVSLRRMQLNVVDYDNNAAQSTNVIIYDGHTTVAGDNGWLLVTGTDYAITATPSSADLKTTTQNVTVEAGADIYGLTMMLDINNPVAITVPTGAKAQLYKYNRYYSNTEYAAKIVKNNDNGTTTFYFIADTKNDTIIYRVSMEGKITKSGWVAWGKNTMSFTYTDADKSPSFRLDDYSGTGQANSALTEDCVLLNINSRNHLSLSVGQTRVLKAYRAWEIIPVSYNNYILTPDFHYTVLSGEDVVSLTPKASSSATDGDWMTLTALKEGIAIIEVTYDAMEVAGGQYDGIYGASDPARAGFVVVQVGGSNDTSVKFGIDCLSSIGTKSSTHTAYNPNKNTGWDAEFDTLYFEGTSGKISLVPTASSAITQVAVSNDKGVTWTALAGDDGTYTAKIVSGNNIIRVTTENGVAYQVVRGDQVTVTYTEVEGKSDGDGEIEVGETIRVTIKGLHTPIPKMAGLYNPGYGNNSDGYSSQHLNYTANGEAIYGPGTQYTFITTHNYVEVVIPESGVVKLSDGYIGVGVVGETAFYIDGNKSHRNISDDGIPGGNSQTQWHTRSMLPELTITAVDADTTVAVTAVELSQTEGRLEVGEKLTLSATIKPHDATIQEVVWASSDETVATVVNGVVTAVGAGSATITATAGDCSAQCAVTVTKPAPIAVTAISLNVAIAEMMAGKKLTLAAVVTPDNATDKTVTWTSSNPQVATVSGGIVTAVAPGKAVITASAGDVQATCQVTVEAGQSTGDKATVYFSVSHDGEFIKTQKGAVAALQKLEVPFFDLDQYGLGRFETGENNPTMLHLYIYATEVLWCGVDAAEAGKGYLYQQDLIGTNLFAVSGTPGSICFDKFWGYDMNLNYYHNYAYPADSTGYGVTADRRVLSDGDVVTVAHFESWEFYGDPSSIFNYLVANGHTVTATVGMDTTLTLNVYRAGADLGNGNGTNCPVTAKRDIYYVKADTLNSGKVTSWTKLGTTDVNGQLKLDEITLEAGQYILAVAGQYGVQLTNQIVSAPGGIVLTVQDNTVDTAVQAVEKKIAAIGEVTLDSKAAVEAAREAYDALTDQQQDAVSNYQILTVAETVLAELIKNNTDAVQAVMDKIAQLGAVTVFDGEKLNAAKAAFDALTPEQQALVENASVLNTAVNTLTELYQKAAKADYQAALKTTAAYMANLGTPSVGATGGEWMVIAMTRAGQACPAGYYDNVIKFVKENINDKEQLHRAKSTENSRVILALTAAGYDVTNVDGHNLLKGLTDMSYVKKQGINGPIWALIAFDSHSYEIPAGGDVTREKLIQTILDAQLSDGGWNLSGQTADPDMTGMALQALAPYCKSRSNTDVQAAVDKALECLSRIQHDNGGYGSIDGVCAESCAQVIVALTSLGIDPETDSRFVKNGVSVVDAMCLYAVNGGGFAHVPGGKLNGMATEQSQYALVSCMRLKNGKTALYNMSDVQIKTQENQKPEQTQKPQEPPKTEETQNPQETQKPQDTQKPGQVTQPVTPYTGDSTQPVLLAVIMLLSLCGTVVFFLLRRRIVS